MRERNTKGLPRQLGDPVRIALRFLPNYVGTAAHSNFVDYFITNSVPGSNIDVLVLPITSKTVIINVNIPLSKLRYMICPSLRRYIISILK